MKMKKILCFIYLIGFSLMSCGKKGPLYLEPERLPLAPEQVTVKQTGTLIQLDWKFPALLSDKKTALDPALVREITVYISDKPLEQKKFKSKADIYPFRLDEVKKREDLAYSVTIPFKTKALRGVEYRFSLAYKLGRKRSPLTPLLTLKSEVPPQPINDLRLTPEGPTIVLNWSKPVVDVEEKSLAAPAGYRVFRQIVSEGKSGEFILLTSGPVQREVFEDNDCSQDGEYVYAVTTLLSGQVESDMSNQPRLLVRDIFPPAMPANLVSFTASDHIFLSWDPVKEKDFSHYRLYRREEKEEEFKLLADRLVEAFYKDPGSRKATSISTRCPRSTSRATKATCAKRFSTPSINSTFSA